MKELSVGFVGGGRVTDIFLQGWKHQKALPAKVVVSDANVETLRQLKGRFPGIEIAPDNNGLAAAQDIVFLAVHPPVLAEVVAGISGSLKPNAVVVSLAPKFTIAKLSTLLGGFARLARVIPNAPSVIGAGFNPVSFSTTLDAAVRQSVVACLAPLGDSPEVAEEKLEGYAVLSAMGPTYFWFQLQALREVAAGFGLSEAEITPALKRMVCGATRTLLESGLTPTEVMNLIPVKPLADMEPQVTEMYRTRLPGVYQKIKPSA
ncbi:MAG TPA: NAD(P)-binding domain-containing protein [Candidatus Sulfotelmatobacter sp.]|nr:NAD(P)-binding domain-containing protein [Candidatus Sulfotelmatobacter sp.]HWI59482.1 NAD(P)-binding domain-containing protein [Bacillota bacterium]